MIRDSLPDPNPAGLASGWAAPERMATPVGRRAFLGILGLSGVTGAMAAALPGESGRNLTSLLLNGGKIMLDQLTCHSFSALINSTFRITNGAAERLEARLLKATPLAGHSKGAANGREPFLLWFHVPGAEGWRQKIYALDHGALGRLDVFLVPIKQENGGLVFEAVFN